MMPNEETSFVLKIATAVTGIFLSFVSGIITTTWIVAAKVKGFDDQLQSVKDSQAKCQGQTLVSIGKKLDDLHRRIDEILLRHPRKTDEGNE